MITPKQRLYLILLVIPFILLIPYLVMKFTGQVNWSPADFQVMGILLLVAGLSVEIVLRKIKQTKHRIWLVLGIVVFFLVI